MLLNQHLILNKMDTIFKASLLIMIAVTMLSSCSKSDTVTPKTTNNISLVVGDWEVSEWGGVNGDFLVFSISASSAAGTVTDITGQGYGFAVGNTIYSDIKANSDGTYSCNASYSANGSGTLSTRAATMSLQNNNTQLTVYYRSLLSPIFFSIPAQPLWLPCNSE
jgi:hypothetical protein